LNKNIGKYLLHKYRQTSRLLYTQQRNHFQIINLLKLLVQ